MITKDLEEAVNNQLTDEDGDVIWRILGPSDERAVRIFTEELQKELGEDHPLYGLDLTAVAKSDCADDVLYYSGTEYYSVHLTFNAHEQAGWPRFQRIESQDLKAYLDEYFERFWG